MIRRVPSRQRVVSWDAFDATTPVLEESSSTESTGLNVVVNQDGKRLRSSFDIQESQPNGTRNSHLSTEISPVVVTRIPSDEQEKIDIKPVAFLTPKDLPGETDLLSTMLTTDLQLHLLEFLNDSSLSSVCRVSSHFRELLLHSIEAKELWKTMIRRKWPVLQRNIQILKNKEERPSQMPFLLSLAASSTPTCIDPSTFRCTKHNDLEAHIMDNNRIYAPNLLRQRRQRIAIVDRHGRQHVLLMPTSDEVLQINVGNPATKAYQFIGRIGEGNRCIRADQSLPRPQQRESQQREADEEEEQQQSRHRRLPSLLERLRGRLNSSLATATTSQLPFPQQPVRRQLFFATLHRGSSSNLESSSDNSSSSTGGIETAASSPRMSRWINHSNRCLPFTIAPQLSTTSSPPRPFVVPFCVDNGKCYTYDLTPRWISYFEITIENETSIVMDDLNSTTSTWQQQQQLTDTPLEHTAPAGRAKPCVAIGIATRSFPLHARMPGWDTHSYGYHGDDGGLYHGSGLMVRTCGPSFGQGDTVGCGIEYGSCWDEEPTVFFTRNGVFQNSIPLDVAQGHLLRSGRSTIPQRDWYPVVGLDASWPVSCNFGLDGRAFVFDLKRRIREKENAMTCVV